MKLQDFIDAASGALIQGKVLWWNERDGQGILEDSKGNEYYFDSSVLFEEFTPRRGDTVEFEVNPAIRSCLCAHYVQPISQ